MHSACIIFFTVENLAAVGGRSDFVSINIESQREMEHAGECLIAIIRLCYKRRIVALDSMQSVNLHTQEIAVRHCMSL